MAYFSNGTEGLMYQEEYCFKCKNFRDLKDDRGYGCPIWDLHLLWGYKLCNSRSIGKKMLDILIPEEKGFMPKKCSMFLKGKEIPKW